MLFSSLDRLDSTKGAVSSIFVPNGLTQHPKDTTVITSNLITNYYSPDFPVLAVPWGGGETCRQLLWCILWWTMWDG